MKLSDLAQREASKAEESRERNRARMAAAMPECLVLIDALKFEGMFGRVVAFEVFE